jgi:hypothetical protein
LVEILDLKLIELNWGLVQIIKSEGHLEEKMSTGTLEDAQPDTYTCKRRTEAEDLDKRPDRRLFVMNHYCFYQVLQPIRQGDADGADNRKQRFVLRDAQNGCNSNCPNYLA